MIVLNKGVPMPDRNKDFYFEELMSDGCACGRPKKSKYSFCYGCYMSLPGDMRRDLYQKIGDGYEEAYEAAIKWLII